MAQLAIKGHETRGKEVIEILKMLGGNNNSHNFLGGTEYNYYYIGKYSTISCISKEKIDSSFVTFTIEEFIEKYPYKVGDKVNYVKYDDRCSSVYTIQGMQWTGVTIEYLLDSSGFSALTKDLRPYKEETMEDKPNLLQQLKDYFDNTPREVIEKEWHEYDKYNEISPNVEEYLEYVNSIRKPQYPKTYEECFNICFGNKHHIVQVVGLDGLGNNKELFESFIKLKICRDAYWKMACDWKPDWEDDEWIDMYYISWDGKNLEKENGYPCCNIILIFPTEEMRDAFYENFKELIEECKELL